MTVLRVGSASDVGRVRSNNQDATLVAPDLFAVADGMGGHQGGEVASAIAVETLRSAVAAPTPASLVEAVRAANQAIWDRSAADPELRGMGTTLCALAVVEGTGGGEQLMVVNVGDSRAYLFRNGELSQLTRDHSLVEDLRAEGRLTDEEAAAHPHRNILTRALGSEPDVEVDQHEVEPLAGDRFLLCSDGLFNEVTLDRIGATLRRLADPEDTARELVRLANEHGGRDNITVVVVDVVESDSPQVAAEPGARSASGPPGRGGTAVAPAVSQRLAPEEDLAGFSTAAPPASAEEPPGPPPEARDSDAGEEAETRKGRERPARRITWRVALFVVVVLAVLATAAGAIAWYARHTYFVGVRAGEVTIFKGRPGGVLWFGPTVEQRTGIKLTEMPAQYRDDLTKGVDESSLAAARRYIEKLQGIAASQGIGRPPAAPTTSAPPTGPHS